VCRACSQICEWCYESVLCCECISQYEVFDLQSGIADTQLSVSKTSNTLMQENVHFHDQNESWKVDVSTPGFESSYQSAMETDVTLANFLARPVKIFLRIGLRQILLMPIRSIHGRTFLPTRLSKTSCGIIIMCGVVYI